MLWSRGDCSSELTIHPQALFKTHEGNTAAMILDTDTIEVSPMPVHSHHRTRQRVGRIIDVRGFGAAAIQFENLNPSPRKIAKGCCPQIIATKMEVRYLAANAIKRSA